MGKYAKKGETSWKEGEERKMFEVQKIFLPKEELKKFINIKIWTMSTFFKLSKGNTKLNLLINITRGAIFSWTVKC